MKSLLYSIILVCCLCCYGQENELNKDRSVIKNDYQENGNGYNGDNDFPNHDYYEGEYVGNPDFDAKIERPCFVYDLNCIRKYFAEHSKCKIRRGPIPRKLIISQETAYFTVANITTTTSNIRMGGFRSAKIEEFYINRRTNKMVFSINIRGYFNILPTVYFSFYRNSLEPIVVVTEIAVFYESLTFTAVIPNINDLMLHKLEATTYVDSSPVFYIGPSLIDNTNPFVVENLAVFFTDIPTLVQELMLTEAQLYPPAYIQYNICDFGLKVAPVD